MPVLELAGEKTILPFFNVTPTLNNINSLMKKTSVSRKRGVHGLRHFIANDILMLGETGLKNQVCHLSQASAFTTCQAFGFTGHAMKHRALVKHSEVLANTVYVSCNSLDQLR